MMVLYDEQEVMRSYLESEIHEARIEAAREAEREARHDEKLETAKRLLRMKKISYDEIAVASELTHEEVEKLAGIELA